jgi:hypothetical protein
MITFIFGLWILLLLLAAIGCMSASARRQRAILHELERPRQGAVAKTDTRNGSGSLTGRSSLENNPAHHLPT